MHHPDPVLTASLYSDKGLDELIADVVAPFWKRLGDEAPGHGWSLWMLRYNRCGDHLKVRMHGADEHRPLAMRLMEEEAHRHFASLPPAEDRPRLTRKDSPPIDEDDRRDEDYPDRTLRWTRYQRSFVSFGWKNHLDQDEYVARMTAAMAAGGARVLRAVDEAGGQFPARGRQTVLLKALVSGLAALDLTAEERADYLAYHRDWLVRWKAADAEREAGALALFDRRINGLGAGVEQIGRAAAAEWAQDPAATRADDWGATLARLAAYLAPLRGDAAFEVDPFTDHPVFPPLFKVMHGLANTLGVGMLDEAFTHHLVLRAAAPAAVAA